MKKFISILSILILFSVPLLCKPQDVTRVKKVETNYFRGKVDQKDTLIYRVFRPHEGSFRKKLIYSSDHSNSLFLIERILIDSSTSHVSYQKRYSDSSSLYLSRVHLKENYVNYVLDSDSSLISTSTVTHGLNKPDKIKEAISIDFDDKGELERVSKTKSYFFRILKVKRVYLKKQPK
jgi:hypothetical protein